MPIGFLPKTQIGQHAARLGFGNVRVQRHLFEHALTEQLAVYILHDQEAAMCTLVIGQIRAGKRHSSVA